MLNYIWLGLIVAGVLIAAGTDWHDASVNSWHNGAQLAAEVRASGGETTLRIAPASFNAAYGTSLADTVVARTDAPLGPEGGPARLRIDDRSPAVWKAIAAARRSPDLLSVHVKLSADGAVVLPDPVSFVKLGAVTNDGIVKSAGTAVELAIGLVGIMALWLGLMKIAEEAGLVAILARLLKPATRFLFPDVPPDHPAMGAMIMNIAANMLGLSNAATPLGLKAMEELNKLAVRAGTATDAMCTFLVINTSNVQLIPATVIAIRGAAGSANPAEILGPVLLATGVSLVVGVTSAKLLSKLPVYRRQLAEGA